MILTNSIGWIWYLCYFLPIDYNRNELYDNVMLFYAIYMLVINFVQPIVQASLAAYISNAYEVGVMNKT